MTDKNLEQEHKWEKLRHEMILRIAEIDSATEWQPTEPDWWLIMMSIQRSLLIGTTTLPAPTPSLQSESPETQKLSP